MTTRIVMFGDSITDKGGAEIGCKEKNWPAQVEKRLRAKGHDVTVFNAGIGGNTTEQGLARIDREVLSRYPHVTFIEFGFNDRHEREAPGVPRVAFPQFVENLRKIVTLIQHVTHGKVVMIANHPTMAEAVRPKLSERRPELKKHYNRGVRKVAREMDLPLLDLHAHFADAAHPLAELTATDGLHLSKKGAKRYAELVCRFIEENDLLA